MFTRFAAFWINNKKLSFVIILLVLLSGVFSWLSLPKQYNPDIEAPAYQILLSAPGYSSQEVANLIVEPLENKLFEIEGVEHVYGYANKDYASLMVTFFVGQDKERATTRLYNKIASHLDSKPLGVSSPLIKAIDPDELPIYTFALVASDYTNLDPQVQDVRLRKVGLGLLDELKSIPDTSSLYLVGGEPETITIALDMKLLEAKNVDIMQVYQTLEHNNIILPAGEFRVGGSRGNITIDGSLNTLDKVRKLVVTYDNDSPVMIEDVALVKKGVPTKLSSTYFTDTSLRGSGSLDRAVFVSIAKKPGTNAVVVVDAIKETLARLTPTLPQGYTLVELQNEGATAGETTTMLLVNLIQSIVIVLIVLTVFLGSRNALNVAISIPLTLSIVFVFALIAGDNINRITLFALILVLGMLVDDATVVVENINRHMTLRAHHGKTKLEAVFDAIREVELGVVLSTVTRLLAFGAMFFVTGMMGSYMGPIPQYAIVAMITSTVVALSINPFLTHILYQEKKKKISWLSSLTERFSYIFHPIHAYVYGLRLRAEALYTRFMHYFVVRGQQGVHRRRLFVRGFWSVLVFVLFIPPLLGIFKMRMLPKSDQNQIYIWVDMPESATFDKTETLARDLHDLLLQEPLVERVAYWVGLPPSPDFANVFRGASDRQGEHYLSLRVNLISARERRVTSETFTQELRLRLQDLLSQREPAAKLRVLEDPPGPPVQSTFLLEVAGTADQSYRTLEQLVQWLEQKLHPLLTEEGVVDIGTSVSKYKTHYQVQLDHELLSRLGLSARQVGHTLRTLFYGVEVSLYHDEQAQEPVALYLTVQDHQKYDINSFDRVMLTSTFGKKVPLKEIANIQLDRAAPAIYSNDRRASVYLYGEMGNNSVIYPAMSLFAVFAQDEFWDGQYELEDMSFYDMTIRDLATDSIYTLSLGGEWELTIDTFRDLGLAMIIAFLAIFFVMVAQFRSFGLGGVIMLSFLFGFFGVFPFFSFLYLIQGEYFSATSMIGVIALAGIVVGNAILLLEYVVILLKRGKSLEEAVVHAGWTRMKPILVTSLTTILGATTILGDPVWSGLALAIIGGLLSSAFLTPLILPIFLYKSLLSSPELVQDFKNS